MSLADAARKLLVGASLMTIAMSFVLDPSFATDLNAVVLPEPATTTLFALAGVVGLGVALIRRRKK